MIRGETYRVGGQCSRKTGTDTMCTNAQTSCLISMKKFIFDNLDQQFIYDIHIQTYRNQYVNDDINNVLEYLKHNTKASNITIDFGNVNTDNQESVWSKGISNILSKYTPDNLLVIRPDMMFKTYVLPLILDRETYTHGFRIGNHFNWSMAHKTINGNVRISDTIQWIPSKYFDIARIFPGHDFHDKFPNMRTISQYMNNSYSDTDSSKCQNDIYELPIRPLSVYTPVPNTK